MTAVWVVAILILAVLVGAGVLLAAAYLVDRRYHGPHLDHEGSGPPRRGR